MRYEIPSFAVELEDLCSHIGAELKRASSESADLLEESQKWEKGWRKGLRMVSPGLVDDLKIKQRVSSETLAELQRKLGFVESIHTLDIARGRNGTWAAHIETQGFSDHPDEVIELSYTVRWRRYNRSSTQIADKFYQAQVNREQLSREMSAAFGRNYGWIVSDVLSERQSKQAAMQPSASTANAES